MSLYKNRECPVNAKRYEMLQDEKADRERKLRALELKIRMRRFQKLKEELNRVKTYLLNDIEIMEQHEESLPDELKQIKNELLNHK